ncbi:MAG: hypothetical protein OXR84_05180 [Magnetovibrio sp.]|nr:hypothetical protein [Magnetovibrio sp.]
MNAPSSASRRYHRPARPAEAAGFIVATSGRVVVYRDDGMPLPLRSGDPVYTGDVLEAERNGAVEVTVLGMTTLTAGGNGRLVVSAAPKPIFGAGNGPG